MSFYTYAHSRESDGKVFYIGKGKGQRAWATATRSEWWTKTASKHGFKVEILARWDSESEAFEHERFLIATMRDLGHPLVNMTDGGEGFSGGRHSDQWKQAMSARLKGRLMHQMSDETRAKISATLKAHPTTHWRGKKHRPESIEKRTASRKRNVHTHKEGDLELSMQGWADRLQMHPSSIKYRIATGKPLLSPKHSRSKV